MKHEIRWNDELREWFCVRYGRTSEKAVREDAQAEVELLFECQRPLINLNAPKKEGRSWGRPAQSQERMLGAVVRIRMSRRMKNGLAADANP
jgi:uncharacterized protein (DUF4415 family)